MIFYETRLRTSENELSGKSGAFYARKKRSGFAGKGGSHSGLCHGGGQSDLSVACARPAWRCGLDLRRLPHDVAQSSRTAGGKRAVVEFLQAHQRLFPLAKKHKKGYIIQL